VHQIDEAPVHLSTDCFLRLCELSRRNSTTLESGVNLDKGRVKRNDKARHFDEREKNDNEPI
jgi:hypothetical protein